MRMLIATCLLAAAAHAAPQDPPPTGPKTAFVFRWPAPSSAMVTETTLKNGRNAVTRYRLEFLPGGKPDERLLRLRDFEFVKLEGLDLDDPAVQRRLGPVKVLAQAIPDLAIGSDGSFRGVTDVDAMIERCLALESRLPDHDPRRGEAVAAKLREPQMKELMSQSGSGFWNCWAGYWAGRELAPGSTITAPAASMLSGSKVPGTATIRYHGQAEEAGCVKLSMRLNASGAEVARSLLEVLAPELLAKNDTAERLKDMKLSMSAEVVLDPVTMQPRKALSERRVEVTPPGEKLPVEQVERRSYEFAWK